MDKGFKPVAALLLGFFGFFIGETLSRSISGPGKGDLHYFFFAVVGASVGLMVPYFWAIFRELMFLGVAAFVGFYAAAGIGDEKTKLGIGAAVGIVAWFVVKFVIGVRFGKFWAGK